MLAIAHRGGVVVEVDVEVDAEVDAEVDVQTFQNMLFKSQWLTRRSLTASLI